MSAGTCTSDPDWLGDYHLNGYHFPLAAFSETRAQELRRELETVEAQYSDRPELHALAIGHANAVLPFVDAMTRLPSILEPIKAILGPDVLVWNASFFIKQPRTEDYISWHQDLTYWGLSDAHEVTAWVALTTSNAASGCVKFIPGSHTNSIVEHRDTFDENNLLSRGQELAVDVDENEAVSVELRPGEMSLHHGRVFHGSHPNRSDDRRIGLAIRYITPAMKQTTNDKTHARLVAGEDRFGHFRLRAAPRDVLHSRDVSAVQEHIEMSRRFLFAGTERS